VNRTVTTVTAALAVSVLAAGCAGGSTTAASTAAHVIPVVSSLPASGTVRLRGSPGKIYTVAGAGTTLRMADVSVRVVSVRWATSVPIPVVPPGTRIYAVIRLRVANPTSAPHSLPVTQIWLQAGRAYLASAGAVVAHPLVGALIPAGGSTTGTLVFPLPARPPAPMLLVYRSADATAIARATVLGLLRLS